MNPHIQNIVETEHNVSSIIRASHDREFKAVDAALGEVLRGLEDFASRKQRIDDGLERARLLLATRSFNSLWNARQTLERGYYQQAFALVRMAMEDQLVALDIEKHPPTLDALLYGKGELGKGDLSFGNMAERLSIKKMWDAEYGTASAYGAHTRFGSMQGLAMLDSNGQSFLRAGSEYDKVMVKVLLYQLLAELMNVLSTIDKIVGTIGSDWAMGVAPVHKEVDFLRNQIYEWAENELNEG